MWKQVLVFLISTAVATAGQLDRPRSVKAYFAAQEVSLGRYLAQIDEDESQEFPFEEEIYEFGAKSTKRAFFYSLLVPGAGQFYAGSRIKPAVFMGLEAIIWTGYFVYRNKGNDRKDEYIRFADEHYLWTEFRDWWNGLPDSVKALYSHELPWDNANNRPIFNHEYYENIGKYNEFQLGWDDIQTEPPPFGEEVNSPHRSHYLELRRQANDYYQNASTALIVAIGNHLISAFDAALTARKFNRGQKRFSLQFRPQRYGSAHIPMLTWDYRF